MRGRGMGSRGMGSRGMWGQGHDERWRGRKGGEGRCGWWRVNEEGERSEVGVMRSRMELGVMMSERWGHVQQAR
jgi:hypothetical protein